MLFLIVLLGLGSCGRRTAPQPAKQPLKFSDLQVQQRGEEVRLSWVMRHPIADQDPTNVFGVKELIIPRDCVGCEPKVLRETRVALNSGRLQIEGQRVFYYVFGVPDLQAHVYQVWYESLDGDELSGPQVVVLERFVDFPALPELRIAPLPSNLLGAAKALSTQPLPDEENLQFVRLSWKPVVEKILFESNDAGVLLQTPVTYRANIYKRHLNAAWTENPINPEPIKESFLIDFVTLGEEGVWYELRLVDSTGNESSGSKVLW